ncbi:DUF5675 family protein [Parazoarcus communis]|uniref:DUF5675 domain-containing protein n=1 Tax=Parazoarcus communis SWub3 = DSM 12120 TaxID=1121029 RepID=A0A323UPY7_9RHOO|nr:DUF5675 family protein [Parazoarcus communis]NMG71312.1 hypothetical protein [Parazoarcus communis SWub3 = DSM 12120]PZA15072.1 hypothetical protein DNK49_18925 [Azoarcus communis] [Parazoarcus communis SWub3 = DSM 12120]
MSISTIEIVRKWETANATVSVLTANNGSIKGYVLERPGPDTTQAGLRLRIPEGIYRLKWHNSNIDAVKQHNPVPLLYNNQVSEGRYILIHNGNYPHNTDGCLLVGETRGTDFVGSSVSMLQTLKAFLQSNGIENVNLSISSSYQ